MNEPAERLQRLLEAAGMAEPAYARLQVSALPRARSAMAHFEFGDPQGVPLLCLHGLSVSGLCFEPLHEELARQGIRAIAPCMLGGIHLDEPTRTLSTLADELIELMDVLGVARFDVLGFSWGTLPQLAIVARVPDRIGRAGLVGPMLPTRFVAPSEIERLKPDVRASLALARHAPALHRGLMGLVGWLPVAALLRQFEDERCSEAERAALAPGGSLRANLAHWIEECRRTGSGFYTRAWQMMLEEPGYALSDLASSPVDLRLYVAENDSVHLPVFADRIAAARCGIDLGAVARARARTSPGWKAANDAADVHRTVFSQGRTHIRMVPGAGRMACMLYLRQALGDLMAPRLSAVPTSTTAQPPTICQVSASPR